MATTPRHGSKARLLCNTKSLSTMLNDATMTYKCEQADVSVWQATDKEYIPGLRVSQLKASGIYVGSPTRTQSVLESALGSTTDDVITYGPEGDAIGSAAHLIKSLETDYEVKSPLTGAVSVSFSAQSDGRSVGGGVWQAPLAARTSTGALAAVTNPIATAKGGVGHFHLTTASTLTTGIQVRIQHSSNGAVWADLITFTNSTNDAGTVQRSTVSGTVKAQTRANCTQFLGGAAKTATWAAAFARVRTS